MSGPVSRPRSHVIWRLMTSTSRRTVVSPIMSMRDASCGGPHQPHVDHVSAAQPARLLPRGVVAPEHVGQPSFAQEWSRHGVASVACQLVRILPRSS
jgi:hypothetical protein